MSITMHGNQLKNQQGHFYSNHLIHVGEYQISCLLTKQNDFSQYENSVQQEVCKQAVYMYFYSYI